MIFVFCFCFYIYFGTFGDLVVHCEYNPFVCFYKWGFQNEEQELLERFLGAWDLLRLRLKHQNRLKLIFTHLILTSSLFRSSEKNYNIFLYQHDKRTYAFFILISRLHFWTKLSMKLRFQQKSFPFLPNIFAANYTEQQKCFNCKKASFLYFCVFCARNIFLKLFSARSYCLLLLIFLTTWVLHNRENITKYFIMYMPITESYYI